MNNRRDMVEKAMAGSNDRSNRALRPFEGWCAQSLHEPQS